jgi:spore coat protein U-like protein
MKHISRLAVVAGLSALVATPVAAQTTTGTINVNAITTKTCTAPGTYTVNLGEYNGTNLVSGTAIIQFKCTASTPATTRLIPSGSAVAASNGTLKTSPANATPISYTLTPGNTFTGFGSGLGSTANFVGANVTVNVAAGQNPIPGAYSDTIAIEVSY